MRDFDPIRLTLYQFLSNLKQDMEGQQEYIVTHRIEIVDPKGLDSKLVEGRFQEAPPFVPGKIRREVAPLHPSPPPPLPHIYVPVLQSLKGRAIRMASLSSKW